jgi:hypothetical protein
MKNHLLAMLILTSWTQERAGEGPLPAPPRVRHAATIGLMVDGNGRRITLEMPVQPTEDAEADDHLPAQPVMRINIKTAVLERENFDRWLFNGGQSEETCLRHFDDILHAKVEMATGKHKLTDPQRAKLRLAGRGDIKRFFDQVQDRRTAFEVERQSVNSGLAALRRLDELSRLCRVGPFGDGSLFVKTLHRINDDQEAAH